MEALKLQKVGYGTNADHGAGCNIHPPPKQARSYDLLAELRRHIGMARGHAYSFTSHRWPYPSVQFCAHRLAESALALEYGQRAA
jgi:hypothetical protein